VATAWPWGWIPATVPHLIGDTVAQAGQALNAAGLLFGSVTYGVRLHLHQHWPGDVAEPGRGAARVSVGSGVSIRVATAPRPPRRECP